MVNQCLMYRYVMSYEPYNFKGWLHDFPDTVEYGGKMEALRTEYRRYLWDGEFRDTCGARVTTADGDGYAPFSRFEAEDGSSALVICNYEKTPVTVSASLDKGALTRWRTVDADEWHEGSDEIVIPANSAVIVL
jgi:hypothetical protein